MMNEMMNNNGFNDYELCEDELNQVAGGFSFCIAIGFGNRPAAGIGENDEEYEPRGGACAYVGVGMFWWDED